MTRTKLVGLLFCCLMLVLSPAVLAQNVQNNGTIQGTVTDAGGAAVVGAEVTVVSDDVGTTRKGTSNAEGFYAFTELSPGRYHVVVKKDGFKTENQSGIELHIGSSVVVSMKLTVGAVVETLTVEADAVQVNTTDGTLGVITEGQTVRELPLNGLNFIGLTLLVPGASTQDGFNTSAKGLEGGTDISFSGGQRTGNLFTVDGSPINDTGSQRTIFIYPALDSIDEFKIATNSYGPEYGQSGGAQVNIVTKSGTNDLHGSLFYYGRNDALNANDYFNKNTSPELQKPPLRRNDFGFSAGGPIIKNKLFFFTSEEWNRQIEGSLHAGKTPTAAELAGDFTGAPVPGFSGNHLSNCYFNSNLPSAGIIDFPVTDPGTGLPLTNINSTVEGVSPGGAAIIKQYPAANVAPTTANPCPGTNYKQVLNTPLYYYQTNARTDYVLNKSTTIFAKYTRDWWDQHTPSLAGAEWGESGLPAVDSRWTQPSNLATIRVSKVLGASSVNDFQFSYSGNHINIAPGGTQPGLTQQIYASLNPTYGLAGKTAGKNLTAPLFWGPGGYSTLWNIAPFNNREDRYTWTDDYSKVVGTHQLRAGILIAHNLKDQANNGDFNEAPIFWGDSGTCSVAQGLNCGTSGFQFNNAHTGNPIASILLKGTLFGGNENSALKNAATRYQDFEWYVSDTWKASRRLAFNYGFRWSVLAQPYLSDNTYGLFFPSLFNVNLAGSKSCDGILLAPEKTNPCTAIGAGGSSVSKYRGIVANQFHNIAPRVGVAYDLFGDGKTSLRAGVGQFYIRYQLDPIYIAGAQNSPFVANTGGTRNLDGNFAPASGFGTPSFARSPTTDIPNTWQWNVTVEREIFKNSTLEVSYVGTRGIHLQSYQDLAQVTPNCTGPGVNTAGLNIPVGDTCRQFYYIDSTNSPNNRDRFLPYQSFFGQNATLNSGNFDGSSAYHSLQTLFRGKFGHGSSYQATYTWSKLLGYQGINGLNGAGFSDNSNPRLDYGPAGFDRRHIFTGSAVYLLPALKEKNSLLRNTVGGWELAPIVTFESGTPITPGIGPDLSGTGTNLDRPNRVAGQPCSIHVPGLKEQLLNPNAFTLNGFVLGTNGNAGLADCYGPGVNNFDVGFHKDFKVTERIGMQLRFEFFNFFNKTQFQGVNGGLGPSQLCYQDVNGAAVNATYNNTNITNTGDSCFLSGRPFGESNIPNNAYKVVAGPGGVSQTLLSSTFGQATFTRPARQIQYALRFTF